LLRKQQKTLGGYFFLPHPVYYIHRIYITIIVVGFRPSKSSTPSCVFTIQTLDASILVCAGWMSYDC